MRAENDLEQRIEINRNLKNDTFNHREIVTRTKPTRSLEVFCRRVK